MPWVICIIKYNIQTWREEQHGAGKRSMVQGGAVWCREEQCGVGGIWNAGRMCRNALSSLVYHPTLLRPPNLDDSAQVLLQLVKWEWWGLCVLSTNQPVSTLAQIETFPDIPYQNMFFNVLFISWFMGFFGNTYLFFVLLQINISPWIHQPKITHCKISYIPFLSDSPSSSTNTSHYTGVGWGTYQIF